MSNLVRTSIRGAEPRQVLTMLLAGGAGERLFPLTRDEAKPMVPFGGIYRLIDIPLSNCINSGLRKVYILTQHKALTLNRHIRKTWNILSPELGEFVEILSPTKRLRDTWYLGTADAVYQNLQSIEDEQSPYVLILSADHVYKMDYRLMLEWHVENDADVTLATTQVAPSDAGRFGIVTLDRDFSILGFEEKPQHDQPDRSHFNSDVCSASMGIYLFSTDVLLEVLRADAHDPDSAHDFGHNLLPKLMGRRRVIAYDFVDENRKEIRYWRDVGTLDAYYAANMDLVAVTPDFNLYDDAWPMRMSAPIAPPAKFVFGDEGRRTGNATDSLVSNGCIVSGGIVRNSVLSPGVRVHSYCDIQSSILLPNVHIGRRSRIRRAIIAQDVHIPEHSEIGYNLAEDRRAGHLVTESGIVVVAGDPAGETIPEEMPSMVPQALRAAG
ncbi:MAG: glucose-1-phosphate adenylyltransferase [Acidobacteria bacterium]|nr:glucose-1-phosphate adenylyltransferase [Acidobacteriota bacterium]